MSGNPLREQMVKGVVMQHPGEPLTVKHMGKYFTAYPDFDLGLDDLQPFIDVAANAPVEFATDATSADAPEEIEAEPEKPEKPARIWPPRSPSKPAEAAPVESAEPKPAPPTPAEIEAATVRRITADKTLANARVAVINASNAERACRTRLAEAVGTFQRGFPPMTREQLAREHVAEQQEIRRKIANGEMPIRARGGVGKSMVDRIAAAGRGGSPAHGDYRRGALPAQYKGRANYDPRRGPTYKPPSEPQQ